MTGSSSSPVWTESRSAAEGSSTYPESRPRSKGLARRLLAEVERYASERGATVVRLDSNRALTEAIGLYGRAGYVEVAPFNDEPHAHHWFEKRLPGA